MYFNWQIGLLVAYDTYAFSVHLPFVDIHFGLTKHAFGFYIFGWHN